MFLSISNFWKFFLAFTMIIYVFIFVFFFFNFYHFWLWFSLICFYWTYLHAIFTHIFWFHWLIMLFIFVHGWFHIIYYYSNSYISIHIYLQCFYLIQNEGNKFDFYNKWDISNIIFQKIGFLLRFHFIKFLWIELHIGSYVHNILMKKTLRWNLFIFTWTYAFYYEIVTSLKICKKIKMFHTYENFIKNLQEHIIS